MAADLTSITKVEERWRPLDGAEETNAVARIGAASRLLRHLVALRGADVDDLIARDVIDGEMVADLVADAVVRVLKNPDGVREVAIDDYREVRDRDVSAGLLQFFDADLDLIARVPVESGAFTIRPGFR